MGAIGLATSVDGYTWKRSLGECADCSVFAPDDDPTAFDAALVGMGCVIDDRLYYFGGSREPFTMGSREILGVRQSIGIAFWNGSAWTDRQIALEHGPPGS